MKVSVLTTVYNGQEYLDRAIPSILSQSYADLEWIIVDDGSTDNTIKVLNELAKSNPKVKVFSSERLGRAKALNFGIQKSQGEYIVNQDFDDISYPERIKCQIDLLENNKEIGLVGCNYIVNDLNRNERYVRHCPIRNTFILQSMAKYIPFAHTLVSFRKAAWLDAGGYTEPNNLVDIRLWVEMAKKGWKFAGIPKTLGEHFVHSQSFWNQNFQYSYRQKHLASVQWQAIQELKLPWWSGIYPFGRYVYCYLPNGAKSFLRRSLAGSKEQDL